MGHQGNLSGIYDPHIVRSSNVLGQSRCPGPRSSHLAHSRRLQAGSSTRGSQAAHSIRCGQNYGPAKRRLTAHRYQPVALLTRVSNATNDREKVYASDGMTLLICWPTPQPTQRVGRASGVSSAPAATIVRLQKAFPPMEAIGCASRRLYSILPSPRPVIQRRLHPEPEHRLFTHIPGLTIQPSCRDEHYARSHILPHAQTRFHRAGV